MYGVSDSAYFSRDRPTAARRNGPVRKGVPRGPRNTLKSQDSGTGSVDRGPTRELCEARLWLKDDREHEEPQNDSYAQVISAIIRFHAGS